MEPFCNLCFTFVLYYTVLSVPCSLVVTCLERADLLALLCVMFPCDFVTFTYGVSDHDLLGLPKAIVSLRRLNISSKFYDVGFNCYQTIRF